MLSVFDDTNVSIDVIDKFDIQLPAVHKKRRVDEDAGRGFVLVLPQHIL